MRILRFCVLVFGLGSVACSANVSNATDGVPPAPVPCRDAVPDACTGLRVVTKDAPSDFSPMTPLLYRGGFFDQPGVHDDAYRRAALMGQPPVVTPVDTRPLKTKGLFVPITPEATDGEYLFGCSGGEPSQFVAYDAADVESAPASFADSVTNPCSVAGYGGYALMSYDTTDYTTTNVVLLDGAGGVRWKRTGNENVAAYGCGFVDWSGDAAYDVASIPGTATPMDGRAPSSFEFTLDPAGRPTISAWPYDSKSFAFVWQQDLYDQDASCDLHLRVTKDDGSEVFERRYPWPCDAAGGTNGVWYPQIISTEFGAVLDGGDGQVVLVDANGDLVGAPVKLTLGKSELGNDIGWAVGGGYLVAFVSEITSAGARTLQTAIRCDSP